MCLLRALLDPLEKMEEMVRMALREFQGHLGMMATMC